MKKFFLLCTAFAMAMNFTSCGNDDEPGKDKDEDKDSNDKYTLVYNMWMPSDLLKIVDVELSVYNPVSDKTTVYSISDPDDSMFGMEDYKLLDYYLPVLMPAHSFSSDEDFILYHLVDEVENGMKYEATVSYAVNEEKVAALPDGLYTIVQPQVATYVLNEKGAMQGATHFTYTKMTVPKDKAIEYFRQHQSDDPKKFSGTIEASSKNNK